LLEAGAIDGARGILINITGSSSLKLAEVQQACSIIQGAAHEDANIIFGAVMDEKMKDAVKITVIATGFREMPASRSRHQEIRTSFAAAHEEAMEFPEALDPEPVPPHIMSDAGGDDRAYVENPAPITAPQDGPAADVVSLETMRSAMVSNFEQNDLDVPAFLRKRNDVM
jgi:cell division protein FtsZ